MGRYGNVARPQAHPFLPMPVFFFCLARSVRQQQLQHAYLPHRQRDCQSRRSVKCTLVHVCAMLEKQLHALVVPLLRGARRTIGSLCESM